MHNYMLVLWFHPATRNRKAPKKATRGLVLETFKAEDINEAIYHMRYYVMEKVVTGMSHAFKDYMCLERPEGTYYYKVHLCDFEKVDFAMLNDKEAGADQCVGGFFFG